MGFLFYSLAHIIKQVHVKVHLKEIYRKKIIHIILNISVSCTVWRLEWSDKENQAWFWPWLLCCTKCCLSQFFTVECRTEARASAISGVARINLSSLVKMYGFMHKAPAHLCHIETRAFPTWTSQEILSLHYTCSIWNLGKTTDFQWFWKTGNTSPFLLILPNSLIGQRNSFEWAKISS